MSDLGLQRVHVSSFASRKHDVPPFCADWRAELRAKVLGYLDRSHTAIPVSIRHKLAYASNFGIAIHEWVRDYMTTLGSQAILIQT